MPKRLRELKIIGVHPVEPTAAQFDEAVEAGWGPNLTGRKLKTAQRDAQDHFRGLHLFEIEIQPPDAAIDWEQITQRVPGQPKANWQVPYDEQALDKDGRWAFFLHDVDFRRPLLTPLGECASPDPTPRPKRLKKVAYEFP